MNPTTIPYLTTAPVRTAGPADVPDCGHVLASAFVDDPVFRWCIPEGARRDDLLPQFFALVTTALVGYDEVHIAAGGVALWVPAGQAAVPASEAEAFGEALEALVGADAERTFAIVDLLESNHPTEPHHYLWFLGVEPAAQGRGIGSGLLSWMLDRGDREGTPAYLEATSPANRRLYERHGFEVVNELSVAGSPPLWPMWRSPAQVRQATGRSGR
jgi:GNAT superfamily N-acetyltransferase